MSEQNATEQKIGLLNPETNEILPFEPGMIFYISNCHLVVKTSEGINLMWPSFGISDREDAGWFGVSYWGANLFVHAFLIGFLKPWGLKPSQVERGTKAYDLVIGQTQKDPITGSPYAYIAEVLER